MSFAKKAPVVTGGIVAIVGLSLSHGAHAVGSGDLIDTGQRLGEGEVASTALEIGDFDGDGDLDAWVTTYVGPSFIWVNAGDGTFPDSVVQLGGSVSGGVIVEDFDRDGDLDVFVISHSFPSRVWYNDGSGVFTEGAQSLGSASQHAVAKGDLDNDGDIDLFVGSVAAHINTALFNDGNGVFTYSAENTGLGARGVALGDLDGDGDLDVFLAMAGGTGFPLANRVLVNDGSGSFADTGQSLGNSYSDMVALGDLDGDGDLDAFVANDDLFNNDPANTVWLNDGSGVFSDSGQRLGNAGSTDVDLADVDDDGDLDALVSNPGVPDDLWLNDGNGFFANSGQALGSSEQNVQGALGDLDGDGDIDLFSIGGGAGDRVYLNADVEPVCPADVNSDGAVNVLDLIDLLLCFGLPAVPGCTSEDVNDDGSVNVLDLIDVLLVFGTACP